MKKPELLAPAGTMEKLDYAIRYGADAVYLGGPAFGLRTSAGNFSLPELARALRRCHDSGVRCYLTVNSYAPDSSLAQLEQYLQYLADLPFDAYIISDPGVLRMVRRISPERELHLSTQANTINHEAALFWQDQGISRINLAREMTLADISTTAAALTIPCEVFVHGALCIAYSGRCLLSSAMTGRSANQGACTQPCRWKYALVEETRPGEYYPVVEENNTTLVFNSRDLCLLEQLPELLRAGVGALKIEGRMKGIHYLAGVLRVYRAALDALCADPDTWHPDPAWLEELNSLSHRGYTTGFLFGDPRAVGQSYQGGYQRSHQLVASVEGRNDSGDGVVLVRNRFHAGDRLELIGPAMKRATVTAAPLRALDPETAVQVLDTVHPNMRVLIPLPPEAAAGDLLRLAAGSSF
ncbi:peptidase U32 family protein [Trichlorobacter ammonificans]|uniref:tRNA hydroxylation protein P1 n=1 Tax=Trichlorobacter ammonificans TaxID=2916410 RepID=A0ABN8HLE3_9BACT|nr:U32 family peptidase [Trichlorobacter ammonificans]CAH2032459.1 tRNA hydroxylation protein P1 [Trichlorobacter ammonificans]